MSFGTFCTIVQNDHKKWYIMCTPFLLMVNLCNTIFHVLPRLNHCSSIGPTAKFLLFPWFPVLVLVLLVSVVTGDWIQTVLRACLSNGRTNLNDIFEFRLLSLHQLQNDACTCTLYEHQHIICCSYKVQSNQTVAAGKRAERK